MRTSCLKSYTCKSVLYVNHPRHSTISFCPGTYPPVFSLNACNCNILLANEALCGVDEKGGDVPQPDLELGVHVVLVNNTMSRTVMVQQTVK